MADPMRIRASASNGVTDVKVLMKHDMETGQRKDASGVTIPAWHITLVSAKYQDREVLSAQFGPSVSKDPYLNFRFSGGAKGEKVTVSWVDSKATSASTKRPSP